MSSVHDILLESNVPFIFYLYISSSASESDACFDCVCANAARAVQQSDEFPVIKCVKLGDNKSTNVCVSVISETKSKCSMFLAL